LPFCAEEERQRKLAEMLGNAETHAAARLDRITAGHRAAAAEERIVSHDDVQKGHDAFRAAASREVFGAMGAETQTIASRVNSRKHFSAR
jgi:hypothetical protein